MPDTNSQVATRIAELQAERVRLADRRESDAARVEQTITSPIAAIRQTAQFLVGRQARDGARIAEIDALIASLQSAR